MCCPVSHKIARRKMQPLTPPVPTSVSNESVCQAPRSLGAAREVRRNSAMRQARTCYDHLAGVAGVQLLEALLRLDWLQPQDHRRSGYCLTAQGIAGFAARGMDISHVYRARRTFAYGCLDWTERRPHLAGALGAALLDALGTAGVIRRVTGSRTVEVLQPLTHWLATTEGCSPSPDLISSAVDSHRRLEGFDRERILR
jgi:hypothetical protein